MVAWAGLACGVLLVAATLTQLRPFWWDTHLPEHSLEVFQRHRSLLMAGAWARILLLFPVVALAVALPRLLEGDLLQVRIGAALGVVAGALSAVAGAVAVAVGVTAEEFLPIDGSSRAVAVLADCLYWVQDNVLTLSLISLCAALAAFSSPLWRDGLLPGWARRVGQVSPILAGAIPMSFYVGGADHASPLYALPAFAAEAAVVVWVATVAANLGRGAAPQARNITTR